MPTTTLRDGLSVRNLFITLGLGIALVACGSSGGSGTGGTSGATGGAGGQTATGGATGTGGTSAGTGGAAGHAGGGAGGAATGGAAGGSAGGAGGAACGASQVALTVKNYLSWCNVEAPDGSTASMAAEQTVCIPANGTINLSATAVSATFVVAADDWHDVTTQQLTGSNMTSKATKDIATAATCVWVCCPFADGTGCPTTDQCP